MRKFRIMKRQKPIDIIFAVDMEEAIDRAARSGYTAATGYTIEDLGPAPMRLWAPGVLELVEYAKEAMTA